MAEINKKTCKDCKEEKDLDSYYKGRAVCKSCNNNKRRMNNVENLEGTKICSVCSQEKDIKKFRPLRNQCKDCTNKKHKEYFKEHYAENKEQYKEAERKRNEKRIEEQKQDESMTKSCNVCNEVKIISEFRLNRGKCNDCEREFNRKYMENKRKEPLSNSILKWRQTLLKITRKNSKESNIKSYEEFSYESLFTKWFNFCFKDDMSWKNHADIWQIDHIIPCSKFKIESEKDVDVCFDWKNLSPITKKENLTKSHNILKQQVESHIEKLQKFCELYTEEKEDIEEYINNILNTYIQ